MNERRVEFATRHVRAYIAPERRAALAHAALTVTVTPRYNATDIIRTQFPEMAPLPPYLHDPPEGQTSGRRNFLQALHRHHSVPRVNTVSDSVVKS